MTVWTSEPLPKQSTGVAIAAHTYHLLASMSGNTNEEDVFFLTNNISYFVTYDHVL